MKKILSAIAVMALLCTACTKNNDPVLNEQPTAAGQLSLTFDAVLGSNDFALNKDFLLSGKTWNFSQLRYWVSNVVLINSKNEEYAVPNAYFLIEENNAAETNSAFLYPANKREEVLLNGIPAGDYKSLKFSVGVPEKYNNNLSLQAGELSQLNGMTNVSWMWATSYIFSSLKGKVTEGPASVKFAVETGLNSNFKTIKLDLPAVLRISSAKTSSILLQADVTKVSEGLDLMSSPVVGAQQASAMSTVAENYASKVFTVKSVK